MCLMGFFTYVRLIKGVAGGAGRNRKDAGERMQSSSSKICTEVVITLI